MYNCTRFQTMKSLPRKAWPLMALACSPDGELTPAQMQKSLFLMGKEMSESVGDGFYEFVAHNYGPFALAIYTDIDELAKEGSVHLGSTANRRWPTYILTVNGRKEGEDFRQKIPEHAAQYLHDVVKWVKSVPFFGMLQTIYAEYPEYAVNSIFRDNSSQQESQQ